MLKSLFNKLLPLLVIFSMVLLWQPVSAGGLKDLFKSKARELVDKGKEITLQKAAKLVFPMEEDGASARPSSPILDRFEPEDFEDMNSLPRTDIGGFKLRAGAFQFIAESYCLKPGSYQRPGGNGYMSGPVKGKLAPYINQILQQAYFHQEIAREDIQYLLWGIIAGAKPKTMKPKIYRVAKTLLSRKLLRKLNGGVEGQIPDNVTAEMLNQLPPSGQKLVATLQQMKRLAASPDSSYEDLEQIAVLPGEPPANNSAEAVPNGRWSYHPDGYFIRYFSTEYFKTKIQIVVPEPFKVIRDKLNRIVSVRYDDGSGIDTTYDDSQPPTTVKGYMDRAAYRLKKVVYRSFDKKLNKMREHIVNNTGWIFAPFDPEQQASISAQPQSSFAVYHPKNLQRNASFLPTSGLTSTAGGHQFFTMPVAASSAERIYHLIERINQINDDYNFYHDRARAQTRPLSDRDLANIVDLDHYQAGARAAAGESGDQLGWLIDHFEREQRAIARATQLIEDLDKEPGETSPSYLPWEEAGLPGSHSYSQRRGFSGRPY